VLVLVIGIALFALTTVPYVVAYLTTPGDRIFNGFFYLADDANTYLAKMREGAEGAWLWTDRYISSPVPSPVFLFFFYILWGKIAALLHVSLLSGYHLARLSGALILVFAVRTLSRACLPPGRPRVLAVFLGLVGSGIGPLALMTRSPTILGEHLEALDLHLPELSGLYSVLAIPHFAWAAALMALALVGLMATADGGRQLGLPATAALTALAILALCVIHPQMLVVLALLAGVYLALSHSPWRAWATVAALFVPSLPLLGYDLRILQGDVVVREWSRQWRHQAPGPLSLILGLGIPLILAALAIRRPDVRGPRRAVLVAWLVIVLLMLYLPNPINIQRRLLDGVYLPVALLAALTLDQMWASRRGRLPAFALTGLATVSSLFVCAIGVIWSLGHQPFIYLHRDEAAAMAWLGAQPHCDLPLAVLSDPESGLFIPPRSGDRVYAGHYSETLDYQVRGPAARQALRSGGSALDDFMAREGIDLLFYGPRERALLGPDPGSDPTLALIHQEGSVSIYASAAYRQAPGFRTMPGEPGLPCP
jgi:hypothetical protein